MMSHCLIEISRKSAFTSIVITVLEVFVKVFPAIFTGLYILLAIHIMKGIKMRVKLMEERILKSHKISLFNRSSGIISGVKEVISFDPNEIILDTEQGMLMIQGEELHVTKLTVEKGEVEIEGLVYSMVYSDDGYMKGEKGGLLRRLFH